MSKVIHIESPEQFEDLIQNGTTIVDFSASWCGPCIGIAPFFEELAEMYQEIQFMKVDVDQVSEVSYKAGVRAMPTFILYKNGVMTTTKLEGANARALEGMVKTNLSSNINVEPQTEESVPQPKPYVDESQNEEIKTKKSKCTIL